MISSKLQGQISKLAIDLLLEEPFFGQLLVAMVKRKLTNHLPIALDLVSSTGPDLLLNEAIWLNGSYTRDQKVTMIKHELLHLIFAHPVRALRFSNADLFDIAADLCVQSFLNIKQDLVPDLPPYRSAAFYYELLSNLERNERERLFSQTSESRQRHTYWRSVQQLDTQKQQSFHHRCQSLIRRIYVHYPPSDGMLSNMSLRQQLELALIKKEFPEWIDWKHLLRRFLSRSRATFIQQTFKRPSKRYKTVPGITVRNNQKILVCLDTSGSIPRSALALFFHEIQKIWKNGAEVYILETDYKIRQRYIYRGHQPSAVKGRGSTSYNKAIEWANKHYHPDAMIYFTDGFAGAPIIRPLYPILWLISPGGIDQHTGVWNQLPGTKIKMTG